MIDKKIQKHDNIWEYLTIPGLRLIGDPLRTMSRAMELDLFPVYRAVRHQQHQDLWRLFNGP